jgi:acyl carrier protein
MSKIEKLNNIFKEIFSVDDAALAGLNKDNVDGWDSVHQLSLTSTIEDEFDIMLDAEDIIEFTSYENAKKILAKYEIEL